MRNHKVVLLVAVLVLISCGRFEGRKVEKVRPLPVEGQVLRDAKAVVASSLSSLQGYGVNIDFRMGDVALDPYEKDLCTATVLYNLGSMTGTIGVSYRWTGEFWTCTGGRDLGVK